MSKKGNGRRKEGDQEGRGEERRRREEGGGRRLERRRGKKERIEVVRLIMKKAVQKEIVASLALHLRHKKMKNSRIPKKARAR